MKSIALLACAVLLPATLLPAAHAGTIVTTEVTDHSDNSVNTQELKVDHNRLRVDVSGRDGRANTIVYKDETLYVIDHGAQSYHVMDEATMTRLGDTIATVRQQMDEQMAGLPPEQRAMVARMMGKMGGAAPAAAAAPLPHFTRTSRTQTIVGIPCQIWEASDGGAKSDEVCVAAKNAVPGAGQVFAALQKFGNAMTKMTSSLGFGGGKHGLQDAWRSLEQMDGIPLAHRGYEAGRVTTEMQVTSVRAVSLPPATFDVPAGYKLKVVNMGAGE